MTAILGISAFYHDSAVALVVDGKIVAAAQEERFTRKKHDANFPENAIQYCLDEGGITAADLDFVGFYEKPLMKFDRFLETNFAFAPTGYRSFRKALPRWLKQNLRSAKLMDQGLQHQYSRRFVYPTHHQSHAAAAFFPSPFQQAAILTCDGVGEWATTCMGRGDANKIELHQEIRYPHSLGLLYSAFTYYLGFRVNNGEYKVMGLAPYGEPKYVDTILQHLIDLKPDGSFHLDMKYFDFAHGLTMTNRKFHQRFGAQPRQPDSEINQQHKDLAASIQAVTEEIFLRIARHLRNETGLKNLVLGGGVALNCAASGKLVREKIFENIWIQPAAGDAGSALGVALFIWYQLLGNERNPQGKDSQQGSRLGPAFSDDELTKFLIGQNISFQRLDDQEHLCHQVANLLAEGKVVGWFQGRMEYGPRALGSRSILADPRNPQMQSILNQKIKFRESFRPFAPAVLQQFAADYFQVPENVDWPYMTFVAPLREELFSNHKSGNPIQSPVPAVTHLDGSSRVQTVDSQRDPLFHRLLSQFHELTGCPMLVNTSFNVRGEPIVCTPQQAYQCFENTEMDILILGNSIIKK